MKRSRSSLSTESYTIPQNQWMTTLPKDISQWIIVQVPIGKRCILMTNKNGITLIDRHNRQITLCHSAVFGFPKCGGSDIAVRSFLEHVSRNIIDLSNNQISLLYDALICLLQDIHGDLQSRSRYILDVIYHECKDYYYIHVLDVLHWGNISFLQVEAQARLFWIQNYFSNLIQQFSRIFESYFNFNQDVIIEQFSMIACPFKPCISVSLDQITTLPSIDGYLFYDKDAIYHPGSTDRVLWIKPYMLTTLLNKQS